MKCKEYEIKIKDIKKQNTSLETAKRKITDILRQINYVPFTHSADDDRTNETNPEPGIGLLYLSAGKFLVLVRVKVYGL